MADAEDTTTKAAEEGSAAELEGGSYEVIRARLVEQAKELGARTELLNERRQEVFGGTELSVVANERVRTENNCTPRDIVQVGGRLLFGYNVFLGLKTETAVTDVFSLHKFEPQDDGSIDLSAVPFEDGGEGFISDPTFTEHFHELYRFYKDARLVQLSRSETKLLAVWQIGGEITDVRVARWTLSPDGRATYIDNRGERDYEFPPQHDFEWTILTREDQVSGDYPHVSIRNKVFVETTGGDLTVKVENNTATGKGIYAEPVDDAYQTLDDATFQFREIGPLVLMRILPYREERWRHLVFCSRTEEVVRIDAIGQACRSLPEDHGIIFPGGYFLQDGQYKVFDGDYSAYEFHRAVRSPNGEDVLYVFHERREGRYALFPYNLIRREVGTPILCSGYSLFDNGFMVVFRFDSDEPTRVHPMQVWKTPFVSDEHAAAAPDAAGFLGKVGNAELVRGISDCLSVRRFIIDQKPSRQVYEDLISTCTRIADAYYWIGDQQEVGDLASVLHEIRSTAELVVDEFEKVVAIKRQAAEAITAAADNQEKLIRGLRPDSWSQVDEFMGGLTRLRTQRGHLITLREMRYMDLLRVQQLEDEVVASFDSLSKSTVDFLLRDDALEPLTGKLDELLERTAEIDKAHELQPLIEELEQVSEGLNVLSEVAANLQVDDPTARTRILEGISLVFAHLNRVRATVDNRRKSLMSAEGKAEFAAQFNLLGQAVTSAIGMADTPEKCDEQLSRLMVQLEELEAKFSEFDEFLGEISGKREEIYEAFGNKKQQLLDERQRRVQNLVQAADRILQGVNRRARSFKDADELNAYFASDAMVLKLRDLVERILGLGDSVKADEVQSQIKSARQDALRGLRDRLDLFEDGANLIKLGRHRFSVNTQPLELGILPHGEGMALSLSGTDFLEPIEDEGFAQTRPFWSQQLVSETPEVYRGEYLAASIIFDAEAGRGRMTIESLREAALTEEGLGGLVRKYAAERYQEGYERGVHDHDGAQILEKLMALYTVAGLLRFGPSARALACLYWAVRTDERKPTWHRRAQSLARLRRAFAHGGAAERLVGELREAIAEFVGDARLEFDVSLAETAARYLVEELAAARPSFTTSAEAQRLRDALIEQLDAASMRHELEQDLQAIDDDIGARVALARVWVEGFVERAEDPSLRELGPAVPEAAVLLATGHDVARESNSALTSTVVEGLLGQHPRVKDQRLPLRLDEFIERLGRFVRDRVPGYLAYREQRQAMLERERHRLRLDEFKPRVLSSFVRNKLINEVYLPLIGDNLAKQLGAAGEGKRTDLMGLLLLISPPGYGKTTLMEYVASRLGLVFMKVNGPSLGHDVHSLDPAEAPNATARQEVEKINLAFEMGNNVMLYLDDIQHTHPELLQKFISLCDAQRRIEGVWRGRTRTYDLRGKKFCVVMAGNPYTESGDKFVIPDMLANRADTYNLGDILGGKEEQFALSYIENAITSNPVLAPMATREQSDIYKLVRMAQGEEIPSTDLSHGYSAVELGEVTSVLKRLFRVQEVLLQVNQQYIASASMDDAYRSEPPFKLQGSYRNMNKLAEKVVAAMNERELEALIEDHYVGEAQTLTTGAEQNLLKLAEIRGALDDTKRERWEAIKKEFKKQKMLGGAEDDPVVRITAQLSSLGERLEGIQGAMGHGDRLERLGKGLEGIAAALAQAQALSSVVERLGGIEQALGRSSLSADVGERLDGLVAAVRQAGASMRAPVAPPPTVSSPAPSAASSDAVVQVLGGYLQRLEHALQTLAHPQVQVRVDPPAGVEELLAQQIAIIERTLVPLVRTTNQQLVSPTKVDERVAELLHLLRGVDERLRQGYSLQAALPRGESEGSGGRGGGSPAVGSHGGGTMPPAAGSHGGGTMPPAAGRHGAAMGPAIQPPRVQGAPAVTGERPGYWRAPTGAPGPAQGTDAEPAPGDGAPEQWRPPPRFRPPSGS
ncbi:MAG: DNA repair ATPase [Myxococcales bacterium]|nr:DNA repair ATPase [Myxococcales bacterium]